MVSLTLELRLEVFVESVKLPPRGSSSHDQGLLSGVMGPLVRNMLVHRGCRGYIWDASGTQGGIYQD